MKIVYVRWHDAVSQEAAEAVADAIPGLVELQEVGWLLKESETAVLIGMELGDDDTAPGRWRLHIPKVLIKEMKVVPLDRFLKSPSTAVRKKKPK